MTAPHDRPTAAELVEAVREFLERDVAPALEGRVAFHLKVAMNSLAIVERELSDGRMHEDEHRARLAALGVSSDRELVDAIRAGRYDRRESELLTALEESVRAKLGVANPKYMGTQEP